jgi:hypothetical protein
MLILSTALAVFYAVLLIKSPGREVRVGCSQTLVEYWGFTYEAWQITDLGVID